MPKQGYVFSLHTQHVLSLLCMATVVFLLKNPCSVQNLAGTPEQA
jgi:hypothetical protein